MIKTRILIALAGAAMLAGTAALAETTTADTKPAVKKTMKHHAHKSTTLPAGDMYLRAAGSEPAAKAAK